MRVRTLLVCAALLAGCSSGSNHPAAAPSASVSATPTASTPYDELDPPDSPGVGSYDPLIANRAYEATHGTLATALLEPATLLGTGDADLVGELQGPSGDTAVVRDLGRLTQQGLGYRPRFARGVTLGAHPISVTRSVYTADAVRGLGGEQGLRVTWTGALTYSVLLAGKPYTVGYDTTLAFVYSTVAQDVAGIVLQAVSAGPFHATSVVTSCLPKGLLLPSASPTAPCPL